MALRVSWRSAAAPPPSLPSAACWSSARLEPWRCIARREITVGQHGGRETTASWQTGEHTHKHLGFRFPVISDDRGVVVFLLRPQSRQRGVLQETADPQASILSLRSQGDQPALHSFVYLFFSSICCSHWPSHLCPSCCHWLVATAFWWVESSQDYGGCRPARHTTPQSTCSRYKVWWMRWGRVCRQEPRTWWTWSGSSSWSVETTSLWVNSTELVIVSWLWPFCSLTLSPFLSRTRAALWGDSSLYWWVGDFSPPGCLQPPPGPLPTVLTRRHHCYRWVWCLWEQTPPPDQIHSAHCYFETR